MSNTRSPTANPLALVTVTLFGVMLETAVYILTTPPIDWAILVKVKLEKKRTKNMRSNLFAIFYLISMTCPLMEWISSLLTDLKSILKVYIPSGAGM